MVAVEQRLSATMPMTHRAQRFGLSRLGAKKCPSCGATMRAQARYGRTGIAYVCTCLFSEVIGG